jgi:hypothetical protein
VVIILMTIGGYSINDYWWLFMIILLLMVICY